MVNFKSLKSSMYIIIILLVKSKFLMNNLIFHKFFLFEIFNKVYEMVRLDC